MGLCSSCDIDTYPSPHTTSHHTSTCNIRTPITNSHPRCNDTPCYGTICSDGYQPFYSTPGIPPPSANYEYREEYPVAYGGPPPPYNPNRYDQ